MVGILRSYGVLGAGEGLLFTTLAVVGGITYNFFPFMALPLYVSLEQIDPRLLEAAMGPLRVTGAGVLARDRAACAPGIVAGTLLTFIPAAGDFINAEPLGTPKQQMIGNVIQAKFLESLDYPTAAALSFMLMAMILVALLIYARLVGTERLGRDDQRGRDLGRSVKRRALGVYAVLAVAYLMLPIAVVILFSFNKPCRPLQLRLAGVHARQLDRLGRGARDPRRRRHLARGGRARDRGRGRAGDARGDGDRPLPVPRARRDEHPGLPADVDARDRPRRLPLLTLFLNMTSVFTLGFGTIFIAHVMFIVSYIVVTVKARLIGFDRHLEEAAMDLGATELVTFRKVTLPLLMPAIVSRGASASPSRSTTS